MLIKCKECGHDNQLGSMFCRECGKKLDVENIRPDTEQKVASGNIFSIIRKVIGGIILLALIYIMAAMFIPESPTNQVLTEDQQAKATEKYKALVGRIDGRYGEDKYFFTPDEVTYLFNTEMTEKAEEDAGAYAIENMYFTVDSRDYVHLMIQSKLGGKVPVTFALKGMLLEDSTEFKVLKAKMGHFAVPGFIQKKVVEKFTPVIDSGVVGKIINASKDFNIENGEFVVVLKKK